MFRFIWYVLLFALGLAGAAVWLGQMHHLRQAIPDQLPAWTRLIADDASVLGGEMALPTLPVGAKLTLSWKAQLPDADGFVWTIRISGPDADVVTTIRLSWWPNAVEISDGRGAVNVTNEMRLGATGLISVQSVVGRIGQIFGEPAVTGTMNGLLKDFAANGHALGDGAFKAVLSENQWQLEGVFPDNTATPSIVVRGDLSGNLTVDSGN